MSDDTRIRTARVGKLVVTYDGWFFRIRSALHGNHVTVERCDLEDLLVALDKAQEWIER
jgi:hypothetical protein